jgi:simple sugar transport system ATP-binding protein
MTTPPAHGAPLLKLTDICKSFGATEVLTGISVEVRAGEVLCLLGDNGAGKSTLIKILSGFHQPTTGTIEVNGEPTVLKTPRSASDRGIATVHQFGGTFPLMSIGRSFFVGAEPTKGWGPFRRFDRKFASDVAVQEVQNLGITRVTSGDRLVGGLSGGERQALAIGRAVYFGANVLILDEPTAALGVKEAAHVLRMIMQARQKGVAVILVTHNVTHAMTVGDHFAVLIHGALAADFRKGERTREEITDLMAGGEAMAELEAELDAYQRDHHGHVPDPVELERTIHHPSTS